MSPMPFPPLRRCHLWRLLFGGLPCLGLAGPPRLAAAAHPFTKGFTGVVQSIDLPSKTTELRGSSTGKALKLVWNEGTHFLADGSRTTADARKAGTLVKVKYHEAPFGHDDIRTIEWHSPAPAGTPPPVASAR